MAYFLLGVPISNFSFKDIVQWTKKEEHCFKYIITPNVDHIVRYSEKRNPAFTEAYQQADIAVLDSRVLQLAIKIVHKIKLPLLPGSDLTEQLFNSGELSEMKVAIIGGSSSMITIIKEHYHLQELFHYNPPMGFIDNPDKVQHCIDFVMANQPKVLFLAVGSPRQEILASILKQTVQFSCKGFCVGASLDFLAGKEKRAPIWMQRFALEWFYRFIKDPKGKFKRYFMKGPMIFTLMIRKNFITSENHTTQIT